MKIFSSDFSFFIDQPDQPSPLLSHKRSREKTSFIFLFGEIDFAIEKVFDSSDSCFCLTRNK